MKTKIKTFDEIEVGDWFRVAYIPNELMVMAIDYEKRNFMVTSPSYLANDCIGWAVLIDETFEVIGTSKENIWHKLFFKCPFICPWKRVDLV
jgi:hypothetical protein